MIHMKTNVMMIMQKVCIHPNSIFKSCYSLTNLIREIPDVCWLSFIVVKCSIGFGLFKSVVLRIETVVSYSVLQLILWNGTSMICFLFKWIGELHLGSSRNCVLYGSSPFVFINTVNGSKSHVQSKGFPPIYSSWRCGNPWKMLLSILLIWFL